MNAEKSLVKTKESLELRNSISKMQSGLGAENDMETFFFYRPEVLVPGAISLGRQIYVSRTKRVDLICQDSHGLILIEFKWGTAGVAAILQLESYGRAIGVDRHKPPRHRQGPEKYWEIERMRKVVVGLDISNSKYASRLAEFMGIRLARFSVEDLSVYWFGAPNPIQVDTVGERVREWLAAATD